MSDKVHDIEITVKCVIPGAVSKADLKRYYDDNPLVCATALANNDQGLCGTIDCMKYEIVEARLKS